MQELINFVSLSIVGGTIGNASYDGLKLILGNHFDKLLNYLKENKQEKFEGALEILLEENSELREQIEQLKQGKKINIINITQSHLGNGDNIGGDKNITIG